MKYTAQPLCATPVLPLCCPWDMSSCLSAPACILHNRLCSSWVCGLTLLLGLTAPRRMPHRHTPCVYKCLCQYASKVQVCKETFALSVAAQMKVSNVCVCRVCVDLCSLLAPGEGMLVGNFARAAFLVHSECTESRYINSRPFRVNAGPVGVLCVPTASLGPEGTDATPFLPIILLCSNALCCHC